MMNNNSNNENYEKFQSAEEVWFWFCASQHARENMVKGYKNAYHTRPCVPDDVLVLVLNLNFAGILKKRHINVMTKYGRLFYAPDYRVKEEADDALLWDQAMDRLTTIFKTRGIVECK